MTLFSFLSYFSQLLVISQHVINDGTYYNIFIGHGGARAAQYCKDHLLNYVLNDPQYIQDPSAAMTNAFVRYCTLAHILRRLAIFFLSLSSYYAFVVINISHKNVHASRECRKRLYPQLMNRLFYCTFVCILLFARVDVY